MAQRTRRDPLAGRVEKAPSPIHGHGCFARVAFAAGECIGTYEGRTVHEDGTYVLWLYDAEGDLLHGRDGTNLLRWLNHSDTPNAEFDAFELYARVPIAPGDEITIDYGGAEQSS